MGKNYAYNFFLAAAIQTQLDRVMEALVALQNGQQKNVDRLTALQDELQQNTDRLTALQNGLQQNTERLTALLNGQQQNIHQLTSLEQPHDDTTGDIDLTPNTNFDDFDLASFLTESMVTIDSNTHDTDDSVTQNILSTSATSLSDSTPQTYTQTNTPSLPLTTDKTTKPKPLPLLSKLRNTQYRLRPSDTQDLITIDDALDQYKSYTARGEDGLLALILARDAVFGVKVMAECTPTGTRKKKALPQRELFSIKQAIFECHEECWHDPMAFEAIWKKCHIAIQQGCGRYHRSQ